MVGVSPGSRERGPGWKRETHTRAALARGTARVPRGAACGGKEERKWRGGGLSHLRGAKRLFLVLGVKFHCIKEAFQRQVNQAQGWRRDRWDTLGGRGEGAAGPAPGEGARAAPRRHLSCWAPKGKGLSPPTGASAALGKLRMAAPTLLYLFVYFYRNLLVHSPSLSSSVSMEQH